MIPQDYHIHSHHSVDCQSSIREMSDAAVRAGIPEIGFAEHFDLHPMDPARGWFKLEVWAAELGECRKAMGDRLRIRAGVEAGEPHRYVEEMRRLISRYSFDYVIGSLHWIGDDFLFDPAFFHRPAAEAFGMYFKELERMVAEAEIDVLGHLDVPARLSAGHYGTYNPCDYEQMVRPILRKCIERRIALDVNSSAIRKGVSVLTPGYEILSWYRSMGGDRITLGSDAHRPEDVGADLQFALDAARRAGLRYLTFFERREACLTLLTP